MITPHNDTLQNLLASPKQLDELFSDIDDTHQERLLDYSTRYIEMQPLGKGAIKQVHQCYDQALKRHLAYAEVRSDRPLEYDQALLIEAWLTTTLDHPNIITLHDIGQNEEGRAFYTMDLKAGDDFADYISQSPAKEDLIEQFLKVCYALSYAHAKGILHLDLKPQNIQCGAHGEVLVCDWGLGKLNLCGDLHRVEYPSHLQDLMDETLYGTVKGSPGFMAPEQVRPDWVKDERSDIYGLGCLLYYAITGGTPAYTGDKDIILEQTALGHYTPLRTPDHTHLYGKTLCNIVHKCLHLTPSDRYQSVSDLIRDLKLYRAGHPTSADPPSLILRVRKFTKRHRTTVITCLSLLVILTSITILYYRSVENHKSQIKIAQSENATLSAELPRQVLQEIKAHPDFHKLSPQTQTDLNIILEAESLNYPTNDPSSSTHLNTLSKYQYLNCVRLDFSSAYTTYPEGPPAHKAIKTLHKLSEELQEYSYTSNNRPTLSQLREIFERFPPFTSQLKLDQRIFYYHSVIKYDFECRRNLNDYDSVIIAALQSLYNTEGLNLHISYDRENKSLTLSCPQLLASKMVGYGILGYLDIDHLSLTTTESTDLYNLAQLPIQTLDLSSCTAPYLSRPIKKSALNHIISPDTFSEAQSNSLIRQLIKKTP